MLPLKITVDLTSANGFGNSDSLLDYERWNTGRKSDLKFTPNPRRSTRSRPRSAYGTRLLNELELARSQGDGLRAADLSEANIL